MKSDQGRRREPVLPPELALVARRLESAGVPEPPAHLRSRVLGAVVDALGAESPTEADLLPRAHREPWPAALVLLGGLALLVLVAPWLAPVQGERVAVALPRFADRLTAAGITLPPPAARDDTTLAFDAPGPDQRSSRFSRGGPEETSIAVLRSLPPDHWLKGTL